MAIFGEEHDGLVRRSTAAGISKRSKERSIAVSIRYDLLEPYPLDCDWAMALLLKTEVAHVIGIPFANALQTSFRPAYRQSLCSFHKNTVQLAPTHSRSMLSCFRSLPNLTPRTVISQSTHQRSMADQ